MSNRLRCAIYTRKSTEEGLDQAFNSLEAQREACAAYVKSQTGEGWRPVRDHYDDGGISGGTLERPALQRLLVDIEAGRVNVVVVYKVDRLTRSLSDFAKIVEIFDAHGVSFVSITQQFNTTTSMGRLTLNMLLSFAQFEREVTGERIRDKIAASKQKGMWMGGVVPLGYVVVERKLVVNEAEAETVRSLFRLYLDHGTVRAVKQHADRLGLTTKARTPNNGKRGGGVPFTRGHIYKLLANPLYVGDVVHKGERFDGEHEAIVDQKIWEAVQHQLHRNTAHRYRGTNVTTHSLLTGLLVDDNGDRLVPTYASKAGRRYRYYISKSLKEASDGVGWRLPAPAIETVVVDQICQLLGDRSRLIEALDLTGIPPAFLKSILARVSRLGDRIRAAGPADQQDLLHQIVNQIEVRAEGIRIQLRADTLMARGDTDLSGQDERPIARPVEHDITLDVPVTFKRRGIEMKLVLANDDAPAAMPDPNLIKLVAQAHNWFRQLKNGEVRSARGLAAEHGINTGDVSRILPLAFLAPDIVEAIVAGRQPVDLTATRLKRQGDLPLSWVEQRRALGFG